jgi:hypothetical protein
MTIREITAQYVAPRDLQSLASALKHTKDLLTPSNLAGCFGQCGSRPLARCA